MFVAAERGLYLTVSFFRIDRSIREYRSRMLFNQRRGGLLNSASLHLVSSHYGAGTTGP